MKSKKILWRKYTSPRAKGLTPAGLLPEVGKVYHAFHDGKLRRMRHLTVTVTEVLSAHDFKKKYPEDYKECMDTMKSCYWIWSKGKWDYKRYPYSDYFVIVKVNDPNECEFVSYDREILMRIPGTKQEWTNDFHLDFDGKAYEHLLEIEEKYGYRNR